MPIANVESVWTSGAAVNSYRRFIVGSPDRSIADFLLTDLVASGFSHRSGGCRAKEIGRDIADRKSENRFEIALYAPLEYSRGRYPPPQIFDLQEALRVQAIDPLESNRGRVAGAPLHLGCDDSNRRGLSPVQLEWIAIESNPVV